MDQYQKLARILRIEPESLVSLESSMEKVTGRKNIIEKIYIENDTLVDRLVNEFYVVNPTFENVSKAIIDRLKHLDIQLQDALGHPSLFNDKESLFATAEYLVDGDKYNFLKVEKAKDMLRKYPPAEIMKFLGYGNVDQMLEKEDIFELFCALRFIETTEWMHNFFSLAYNDITPDDFEKRKINVIVLKRRWLKAAEIFMKKKYHNVSHLKELGVIFIIPIPLDTYGELTRVLTLVLHYKNEIAFYTSLFDKYSRDPDFNLQFQSLLRGDVNNETASEGFRWRIVQRYLTKDNPNDPRLFEPHINPEAVHWYLAEEDLSKLTVKFPGTAFGFWKGLDWVGDFFPDKANQEELVSFNLIDTVMSLVEKEKIFYLYHHQEALWNKIFQEYFSFDEMRSMMIGNFKKGYIEFKSK